MPRRRVVLNGSLFIEQAGQWRLIFGLAINGHTRETQAGRFAPRIILRDASVPA